MSLWVSLMQAPSEITLQKIVFGLLGTGIFMTFLWSSSSNKYLVNTVCQQKGPLAKHENCKFPKSFQGGLGMLVGPPSAQKFWPRPACTADFKCYFWLF